MQIFQHLLLLYFSISLSICGAADMKESVTAFYSKTKDFVR